MRRLQREAVGAAAAAVERQVVGIAAAYRWVHSQVHQVNQVRGEHGRVEAGAAFAADPGKAPRVQGGDDFGGGAGAGVDERGARLCEALSAGRQGGVVKRARGVRISGGVPWKKSLSGSSDRERDTKAKGSVAGS